MSLETCSEDRRGGSEGLNIVIKHVTGVDGGAAVLPGKLGTDK
jgi:hypothetical protein